MALENAAEWQALQKELTDIYEDGEARQVLDDANTELLARAQAARVTLQKASSSLKFAFRARAEFFKHAGSTQETPKDACPAAICV